MKFFIVCFLVGVSGTLAAQESSSSLPDAPSVNVVQPAAKRITGPTRLRLALEGADGALRGLDAYTGHHLFSDRCHCYHEVNPIAPNSGNAAVQAAYQAGAGLLVVGGSRWLERRGHPRWATALLVADIVSESVAVGHNFSVIASRPAFLRQSTADVAQYESRGDGPQVFTGAR